MVPGCLRSPLTGAALSMWREEQKHDWSSETQTYGTKTHEYARLRHHVQDPDVCFSCLAQSVAASSNHLFPLPVSRYHSSCDTAGRVDEGEGGRAGNHFSMQILIIYPAVSSPLNSHQCSVAEVSREMTALRGEIAQESLLPPSGP